MMTLVSSLGWFSHMVKIRIEFDHLIGVDSGEEFVVPWDSFTGQVPLINITGYITGRCILTVADGVRVSYNSIVVAIDQYLHYLDPYVSSEMCTRGGWVPDHIFVVLYPGHMTSCCHLHCVRYV